FGSWGIVDYYDYGKLSCDQFSIKQPAKKFAI
ncbi:MAG: hypothetical protein ACJAVY_001298, partial [Marinoscillum sp.]